MAANVTPAMAKTLKSNPKYQALKPLKNLAGFPP
jgi:hypothetical protein